MVRPAIPCVCVVVAIGGLACNQRLPLVKTPHVHTSSRVLLGVSNSSQDHRCSESRVTSNGILLPKVLVRAEPRFAGCHGTYSGNSMISAKIGVDGVPREVRMLHSVAECLDKAAVDALRLYRFCPALRNGRPQKFSMNFVVNVHYR
jgi:outer membrane biosynthesis protein TonB